MKITLNNKETMIKNTFRAYILFEQIMGRSFEGKTTTDLIVLLYCMYLAVDKDQENPVTLDEFIDWMDENPDTLKEFIDWLLAVNKQGKALEEDKQPTKEGSKKKPKKQ